MKEVVGPYKFIELDEGINQTIKRYLGANEG